MQLRPARLSELVAGQARPGQGYPGWDYPWGPDGDGAPVPGSGCAIRLTLTRLV